VNKGGLSPRPGGVNLYTLGIVIGRGMFTILDPVVFVKRWFFY
jgi:hypothetical protein